MTDQDQTIPTTTSTLVDHVVVTNTVVEQLTGHGREVPRYIADEVGQAVLALVPDALTPVQYALLDAVKDVALAPEAPAAKYAAEQLARLAGEAFGYPLPPPVVREGGVAGFLFGRPVTPPSPQPAGTAPIDLAARRARATGGPVDPQLVLRPADPEEPASAQIATEVEGWPFKPGDVVRDSGEDADHGAWLDAAPAGVVVEDEKGNQFRSARDGWFPTELTAVTLVRGVLTGDELQQEHGPVTVVSVPDPQEACTDETQDGPA